VVENSNLGIHITNSSGNHLYGNWLDNRINAIDDGMNFWNDTTGNYWSDYGGEDTNMDGVGDKPYIVNESTGSIDYIPIV
jgi:nitrous oxidase accessory protein NosD